jgi:hypothetical protein
LKNIERLINPLPEKQKAIEVPIFAITEIANSHRPDEQLAAIRQAIGDYHLALDLRAHGAAAASNALRAIERALGTRWKQGEEMQRRFLEAAQVVQVPPTLEGEWLITQPNGRQYVVHSSAKASIACKCGYTVEEIQRTAESASGQSNQCKNTGNQA